MSDRCPIYLMPGMRCASERDHDGLCAPDEPDEPDDEPMTRIDGVDGHEYVVTYGHDRDLHYEGCHHPSHDDGTYPAFHAHENGTDMPAVLLTDEQRTILENFAESLQGEVTIRVTEPWKTEATDSPHSLNLDILLVLDEMSSKVNERELISLRQFVNLAGWRLVEVPDHDPIIPWGVGTLDDEVALHMLTTPGTYHTLRLGRVTADGVRHVETEYAYAYQAPPRLPSGYEEACERAAEAQGVTAIENALTGAGIEVEVEQTGGFCMVAYVRPADGRVLAMANDGKVDLYVYATAQDEEDGEDPTESHHFDTEAELVTKVQEILARKI